MVRIMVMTKVQRDRWMDSQTDRQTDGYMVIARKIYNLGKKDR
jgi:hypothetical protein